MPGVGRFIGAIPILYIAWALPLLLALVLLVPPWQHPDEFRHFLRTAHIADGSLLGHRFGSSAGGRADPSIIASVLPFSSIPFHPENKVTALMYDMTAPTDSTGVAQRKISSFPIPQFTRRSSTPPVSWRFG